MQDRLMSPTQGITASRSLCLRSLRCKACLLRLSLCCKVPRHSRRRWGPATPSPGSDSEHELGRGGCLGIFFTSVWLWVVGRVLINFSIFSTGTFNTCCIVKETM